jgi:tetratricopeptide (TPR) repeat protein
VTPLPPLITPSKSNSREDERICFICAGAIDRGRRRHCRSRTPVFLMKCDPRDAAPPFNLGNMLRANGQKVEAEAALRAATRADPTFAEAWYNLSDLLDEQGRSEAAIDCLRSALHAAPAYADAMFNLALLLQRNNKHAEAAEYWRRYLAKDTQSEWAARARRALKFCEMQMHLSAS